MGSNWLSEKTTCKKSSLIKVKVILSAISLWTSISLFESEILLFFEFINVVLILYYICIEFILLLYILLVISFDWHKEYVICLISLSNFFDILPAFPYARTTGNLWNICLGFNIWFLFLEANDIFPPSSIRYDH